MSRPAFYKTAHGETLHHKGTSSYLTELRRQRAGRFKLSQKSSVPQSALNEKVEMTQVEKQMKEMKIQRKEAYKQRKRNFTKVSPTLWTKEDESDAVRAGRLRVYNRTHKCPHKLWFSGYEIDIDESGYRYMRPTCNHATVKRTRIPMDPMICSACHQPKVERYITKDAFEFRCRYCKKAIYESLDPKNKRQSVIYPREVLEHKIEYVPTKKTWGTIEKVEPISLAEQTTEEAIVEKTIQAQSGDDQDDEGWPIPDDVCWNEKFRGWTRSWRFHCLPDVDVEFEYEATRLRDIRIFDDEMLEQLVTQREAFATECRNYEMCSVREYWDNQDAYVEAHNLVVNYINGEDSRRRTILRELTELIPELAVIDLPHALVDAIFSGKAITPQSGFAEAIEIGKMLVGSTATALTNVVTGFFESLKKTVSTLCDNVLSFGNFISGLSKFSDFCVLVRDIADVVTEVLKRTTLFVPLFMTLMRTFMSGSMCEFVMNVIELVSLIVTMARLAASTVKNDKYAKLVDSIEKRFNQTNLTLSKLRENEAEILEPQDGGPLETLKKILYDVRSVIGDFNVTYLFTKLSRFNTVTSSAKNIGYWFSKATWFLPNFIKHYFCSKDGKTFLMSELSDSESPIHCLMRDVMAYRRIAFRTDRTAEECMKAHAVMKASETKAISYLEENKIYDPMIWDWLNKLVKPLPPQGSKVGDRKEPFVVYISGDSGVGKSTIAPLILSACMPELGQTVEDFEKQIYTRSEDDYWSGIWKGCKCVLYDDFNQDREERDLRELIALVTAADYMPPIANIDPQYEDSLGVKGTVVRPELIICCSNVAYPRPTTLHSEEAIRRRRHVLFDLRFKQGVTKREFDFSHMAITQKDTIRAYAQKEDVSISSIEEMLIIINKMYNEHKKTESSVKASLENFIFKTRPEQGELREKSKIQTNPNPDPRQKIMESINPKTKQSRMDDYLARSTLSPTQDPGDFSIKPQDGMDNDILAMVVRDSTRVILAATLGFGKGSMMALEMGKLWMYGKETAELLDNWRRVGQDPRENKFRRACAYFLHFGVKTMPIIGAAISVMSLWKTLFPQSGEQYNNRNPQRQVLTVRPTTEYAPQTGMIATIYEKNMVQLKHSGRVNNAVFVFGRTFVANYHFFLPQYSSDEYIAEGTQISIIDPRMKESQIIPFERMRLKQIAGTDMVVYACPLHVQMRPSIDHLFNDGNVDLTNRRVELIGAAHNSYIHMTGRVTEDRIISTITKDGHTRKWHNTFEYDIPTQSGDCGALIFLNDDLIERKLIGIHIGGDSSSVGRGAILAKEVLAYQRTWVESKFDFLERKPTQYEDLSLPLMTAQSGLIGELLPMGVTRRKFVPPQKTKLRPSPIHGIYPPITMPAVLGPFRNEQGILIDPYKNGMNKYSNPVYTMDKSIIRMAADAVFEMCTADRKHIVPKTFTISDAINGIQEYPYIDRIETNTSAGLPYCLEGISRKSLLVARDDGKLEMAPRLAEEVATIMDDLVHGREPDVVYLDTLKDERRPIEKAKAGKTRLFSICPFAWAIIGRKLFLPAVSWLYQSRTSTPCAVGMDKSSYEWNAMANYLMEVGDGRNFVDADYSSFDSKADLNVTLAAREVLCKIALLINPDEDRTLLQNYMRVDAQPRHYYRNMIVSLVSGTSSGSVLTVIVNNLVNMIYVIYAWLSVVPMSIATPEAFRRYVRMKVYGDDLLMSISPAVHQYFNFGTFRRALGEHGIDVTTAQKTNEDTGFRTLTEVTFLKCGFRLMVNSWVPVMELTHMVEPLNWIRHDPLANIDDLCQDNCNSVLRAAFFHGQPIFESIRNSILRIKPRYNLLTFASLRFAFYTGNKSFNYDGTFSFTTHSPVLRIDYGDRLIEATQEEHVSYFEDSISKMSELKLKDIVPQSGVEKVGGTLDEPALLATSSLGVTLQEQQITATEMTRPAPVESMSRAERVNPDRAWTIEDRLARKTLVWQGDVDSTESQGTVLTVLDVVSDLLVNDMVAEPFQRFHLMRFKNLVVHLQTVGSRQMRGKILVGFRPTMVRSTSLAGTTPSLRNAILLPHVRLDVSSGSIAELKIPFTYFKQYLNLVGGDCLGQIYVVVLNQVNAAAGAPSQAHLKMWVNWEGAEFKEPIASSALRGITRHRQQGPIRPQSGIISKLDETIVDVISDLKPMSLIADFLGYSLDKPQNAGNPAPLVRKEMGYLSNYKNEDYVETLMASPRTLQMVDGETFSSSAKEMEISYLLNKWAFLETVQWSTTHVVGDILFQTRVGPKALWINDTPGSPSQINGVTPSPIDFVADFFDCWFGGIEYSAELAQNVFDEGRLDFIFEPCADNPSLSYDEAVTTYLSSHQVRNDGNTFSICCPYIGDTPWKIVWRGTAYSVTPSNAYRFLEIS